MKIKIAHLYYDLMNLYGDSGNVKALKMQLENQGVKVELYNLSLEDEIDFKKYDVFYIGSGTEENQRVVLNNLLKYTNDIKDAIEDFKFFICTGNSIELFGNIISDDSNTYKALGIFNYDTKFVKKRLVSDVILKGNFIKDYIIGFQNRSGIIESNLMNAFDVIKGFGSNQNSDKEGIIYKNFFGTYTIGPILVRNPELLKYIIKNIINKIEPKHKYRKFSQLLEKSAYDNFVDKNYKDYLK